MPTLPPPPQSIHQVPTTTLLDELRRRMLALPDGWEAFRREFGATEAKKLQSSQEKARAILKKSKSMKYDHRTYLIQIGLKTLDFDPGPLDGLAGAKTAKAFEASLASIASPDAKPLEDKSSKTIPPYPHEKESVFGPHGTKGGYTPPMEYFTPPYPMQFSWGGKVSRIGCHKLIAQQLQMALQELADTLGLQRIKDEGLDLYAGCYNPRKSRGGSSMSDHAWAIAIDLDPDANGNRTPWKPSKVGQPGWADMPVEAVQVFRDNGFQVGFRRSDGLRRDMMHIAYIDRP